MYISIRPIRYVDTRNFKNTRYTDTFQQIWSKHGGQSELVPPIMWSPKEASIEPIDVGSALTGNPEAMCLTTAPRTSTTLSVLLPPSSHRRIRPRCALHDLPRTPDQTPSSAAKTRQRTLQLTPGFGQALLRPRCSRQASSGFGEEQGCCAPAPSLLSSSASTSATATALVLVDLLHGPHLLLWLGAGSGRTPGAAAKVGGGGGEERWRRGGAEAGCGRAALARETERKEWERERV